MNAAVQHERRSAWIALGANLGDRPATLSNALARLGAHAGIQVVRASRFHETEAVGGPGGQPPYLNAAAELATTLSPHALLDVLLQIERESGRVRDPHERNAPRTLDLDLLFYGAEVLDSPTLQVPHPRLHERLFVLAPLSEIAPELVHPTWGKSVRELLDARSHSSG